MKLETQVQIKYQKTSTTVLVKSIQKNDSWHFFISDIATGNRLLHGETLELTCKEALKKRMEMAVAKPTKLPTQLVSAVKKKLLEDKEWWYS